MLQDIKDVIKEEKIKRDVNGYWIHSNYPNFGEAPNKFEIKRWEEKNGINLYFKNFEYDASEELIESYFEEGEINISEWNPECYSKDSFLLAIFDTEDSPIAIFGVKTQERLNKEMKGKLNNF